MANRKTASEQLDKSRSWKKHIAAWEGSDLNQANTAGVINESPIDSCMLSGLEHRRPKTKPI